VVAVATAMTAVAISATTASAATTRADYVAQVDQICASTTQGFGRLGPKLKSLFGPKAISPLPTDPSTPTKKQLKRSLNRFINRISRILASLNRALGSTTEQIALVAPAPGDEPAVAQWIAGLRQYVTFEAYSIRSLRHHKPRRALAFQRQGTEALNAGGAGVQSFGISNCLTSVPELF
jgi:hypothetical protein